MRVSSKITTGLAALTLALSVPALAEAPASSSGTAVAIMQASAATQSGDCAAAMTPLNQLWHDPYLEQNDPKLAAQFRFQLIACTADTQGIPAALALSAENVSRAYDINAYDLHIFLQLISGKTAEATTTLDAALTRFPTQAPDLTDMSVIGVLVGNREAKSDVALAMLNRLEEGRWQIHDIAGRPLMGLLRLEGLRASVKAGDTVHADLYRTDLKTDTLFYIVSQGDGDLSPAGVPVDPVRPVLNREIEEVKAIIAANPANLSALSYLMNLESTNDQNALALTQLNGILELVDKYGLDKFSSPDSYPGLLTTRGELYARAGRFLDAGTAYETGVKTLGADKSTDLLLSYMNFLVDRGQDQAGLAVKGRITAPDEAQAATLATTEACAQGYSGDKAGFTASLATLTHDIMRIKPYLCAGDSDNAAKAMIAAMTDPATRDTLIAFMQQGLPPISVSDRDDAFIAALMALKTRSDVRTAAEANRIVIRQWPVRLN
jgi:predicted negative regulator of RcsB-dependent stress response